MTKLAKIETFIEDGEEHVVQAPPVITRAHSQDRELSKVAGGARGWRKLSPLRRAYELGKLDGGTPRYKELDRLNAGELYTELWAESQPCGRDSTQALMASRGGGSGIPLSIRQSEAIKRRVAIDSHLGQRDRIILRTCLFDEMEPVEAVALACGDYGRGSLARFREALDALCDAIAEERRNPGVVKMGRE